MSASLGQSICPTCGPQSPGAAFCATCGARLVRGGAGREGTVLAERYRLTKLLGQGGMGEVYAAEHVHISKKFAIKLLRPEVLASPEAVVRFRQEAWAASSIGQENIIGIEDFAILPDGTVYLAMELLDGESLAERMRREPVPLAEALELLAQVCRGLHAAHEKGIVHRDLKPENLLVVRSKPPLVKILDFGIAKVFGGDASVQTRTGQIIGTPQYMSPEQACGKPAGPATDVYSLGVILYELAAGKVPFSGESAIEVLMKHMSATPLPPSVIAPERQVPEEIDRLILSTMAKEPSERPSIMRVAELLELAKRPAAAPPIRAAAPAPSSGRIAVAAPAIAAAPASLPDEAPEGAGRRRTAWIAALALVPIVAGGVLFAAVKLRAPQPAPPAPPPVQGDTPVHPPPVQGADPPAPPPKIADAPAVENGAAERSLVERKHSHAGAKVARGQPAHVREAAAPIGLVDSPPPRREERAAPPADPLVQRIDSQARQMSPGARRVQLFRGEGPRTDWTVNLEANRCYTFVGTVEEGGLYLYLWGPAGRRLAAYHQRTQSGSLYHCAAFAGAYHVQAKLAGGIGSYRLGVYAR